MSGKKTSSSDNSTSASVFDHSDILTSKPGKSYMNKKNVIIGCIILTALVIFGICLYYFMLYRHAQSLLKNPLLASEMQQEKIVANVEKLTQVPTGEQPTIAKISDITKLNKQPFFQNAQNGDFVLIYTKAKEAILYDPVSNKVLRVGPILVPSPTAGIPQAALGAQTSNLPVSVAIYNGTSIAGLAKKTEGKLTKTIKQVTVVTEKNAIKQDYPQTVVVDLKGNNAAAASQIASVLHGTVGSLPSGEMKPDNADLLVILGQH
jgi:LytR cell envelope-related transcriptional attenuator